MKKITALAMTLILCGGLVVGCSGPSNPGPGGLGNLPIDDNTTAATAPSIGGNTPTSAPTEATTPEQTTPEPTTAQKAQKRYYSDSYINCYIPEDWDVYTKKYNDGTGNYRLMVSIYDPEDVNNCIFFMSGLEPFFIDENARNKIGRYVPLMSNAPILEDLSAASLLSNWPWICSTLRAQGFIIPNYVGEYMPQEILDKQLISEENNMVTSLVLADCFAAGSDNVYRVTFRNSFSPFYYAYLGVTYYLSLVNFGYSLNADIYEEYHDLLEECVASFDVTPFNDSNSITGETEVNDDPLGISDQFGNE